MEVDLCGHATLAAASYLFSDVHPDAEGLQFWTRSGWLAISREDSGDITLDFPAEPLSAVEIDPVIARVLGAEVIEALRATDLVCLVDNAETVRRLTPDLTSLSRLPMRGVAITSAGEGTGSISSHAGSALKPGVAEDLVTGSSPS